MLLVLMLITFKLAQPRVFKLFMLWTESVDIFFSFRFDFTKTKI